MVYERSITDPSRRQRAYDANIDPLGAPERRFSFRRRLLALRPMRRRLKRLAAGMAGDAFCTVGMLAAGTNHKLRISKLQRPISSDKPLRTALIRRRIRVFTGNQAFIGDLASHFTEDLSHPGAEQARNLPREQSISSSRVALPRDAEFRH